MLMQYSQYQVDGLDEGDVSRGHLDEPSTCTDISIEPER